MRTMLVSEFKAKCVAVLKDVQRTREPMVVTLRGKPVATVQPFDAHRSGKRLGGLKGQMRIRRDLVGAESVKDWEMLR
jgi:prevent-host-death family protein